jgi:HK97 family phage prohead protease
MELKHLGFNDLELKFAGDDMVFTGYASIFGGVDSYGDTIDPQAYEKTLKERQRPIRMRWNHYGPVIGKWLSIQTDAKGLSVTGQLTPGHSTAVDVYASMKHGAIDGMSIGYMPLLTESIGEGKRLLKQIELVEISVVEEPADLGAKIEGVKHAIENASTIREIENALRDSGGFGRADACALVARIKSMLQGELAAEEKAKREIAAAFQKFIPKL